MPGSLPAQTALDREGMDAQRPLLLFDSGVGGLSVLDAIRRLLPTAPIVYVADSGGFPYGTKSEAEIAARVPALLGRLVERYRPRLVVIACNTASTIALAVVRAALDLPIVGTVPAIKPAALASTTRAIGVLGTNATVRQPYVDRLAAEFASVRTAELYRSGTRCAPVAHRFVKEVLRRWSAPTMLTRSVRTPIRVAGHDLAVGQHFVLSPAMVHQDPGHWRDPDVFDPDRWLSGASHGRPRRGRRPRTAAPAQSVHGDVRAAW